MSDVRWTHTHTRARIADLRASLADCLFVYLPARPLVLFTQAQFPRAGKSCLSSSFYSRVACLFLAREINQTHITHSPDRRADRPTDR